MAETEDSAGTSKEPTGTDVDVSWLACPDLRAIDVLARLHVVGRRCGRPMSLHGATCELLELLELVGLREIVHVCPCAGRSGDRCLPMPRS